MNPAPVWRKLSWLLLIWAASVLALGVVSFLFRLLMQLAGLHSH
ncbi:DUF2474 domain-containing protein [Mangrovibacter sp. MFB070]|nr:DUF2474 domain-containing protein [Mangrovibacter sp. MFB070]